ncbi:MAG: phosphate ABC transporter ATP-binding protein [Bacteroidota bacterium]|nr:phosphate ABC transporter ATP-binding protein [Bacteroidota bacterium]
MALFANNSITKETINYSNITDMTILKKLDTDINPAVKIKNLNVRAVEQHILKNIKLDIPKNKITVLLGPSGCGKTTLLKSLNRLTDLDKEMKVSGNIFINEIDVLNTNEDIPEIRRRMGLLSQKPYPLPVSIYKNMTYGFKLKGIRDKKLINYNVEMRLKEVGLWEEVKDRLHSSPDKLSIGQQQRLCLARGLTVKPHIILTDEPTSALDPTSSKIIEDLFKKLKTHYTIIVVTHVLRQAQRLADNVIFMSNGVIVEQGPPKDLFNNPQTVELKKYLVDGN